MKEDNQVESTEETKVKLTPKTEEYVKGTSQNGTPTLHSGDTVASQLAKLTLDETYVVASTLLDIDVEELQAKYSKLNFGMQRMNLGNRIRGAVAKIDKGNQKEIDKINRLNGKMSAAYEKAVESAVAKHEKEVAKLKEGEGEPELALPEEPELVEVPELVTGKGIEVFLEAVSEFTDAISARELEKEEARAKKEAEAKAKAEAKAEKAKNKADEKAEKAEAKK